MLFPVLFTTVVKIAVYGFDEVNWISDFLSDRKKCIAIGHDVADWRDVTSCVPQGSVLDPIIFVIYRGSIDLLS